MLPARESLEQLRGRNEREKGRRRVQNIFFCFFLFGRWWLYLYLLYDTLPTLPTHSGREARDQARSSRQHHCYRADHGERRPQRWSWRGGDHAGKIGDLLFIYLFIFLDTSSSILKYDGCSSLQGDILYYYCISDVYSYSGASMYSWKKCSKYEWTRKQCTWT